MNIIESLTKGATGGLFSGLSDAAKGIRAAITGKEVLTSAEITQLELKVKDLEQAAMESDKAVMLAQAEINKADATSTSFFRGGWRPWIGWVCGAGLAYEYLLWPFLNWGSAMYGKPTPPHIDMQTMMPLLLGLLGLVGARTFEKVRGVK